MLTLFRIHPELRQHVWVASLSSAILVLVGLAALAIAAYEKTQVPILALLAFATCAIAVGILGLAITPRWYARASWVVANLPPASFEATLELDSDMDSTSLYAAGEEADSAKKPIRIALRMPKGNVKPLLGQRLMFQAYIDPETSRFVCLSHVQNRYWCIPPGTLMANPSFHRTCAKSRAGPVNSNVRLL